MFVKSYCSSISGIEAVTVAVEVNITAGIGMYLVGLPDNAVRESQERIRAAFENCEYKMSGKKVVVNLSPADLRKEGSAYDLPIAVAMLAASGQIDAAPLSRYILLGELSLDGSILPVKGALPIAMQALKEGFAGIILPEENAREAAVVKGLDVYGIGNLREVVNFLQGFTNLTPARINLDETFTEAQRSFDGDFCDVKGQAQVKRALEVAAAGGHNVLMIGPPGSGKTMLARRMPSIMPPLTLQEALETTRIHSVAGKMGYRQGLLTVRPFRTPHHLTSQVALVGGGANPQPGEISLAHNGILFLDELPEFSRNALESLRQPMEEKQIVVSRAKYTARYPANFMLIALLINPIVILTSFVIISTGLLWLLLPLGILNPVCSFVIKTALWIQNGLIEWAAGIPVAAIKDVRMDGMSVLMLYAALGLLAVWIKIREDARTEKLAVTKKSRIFAR